MHTNSLDEVVNYVLNSSIFLFLLYGNLGAGKTHLVKQIAKRLGVRETVTSPTFAICQVYTLNSVKCNQHDYERLVHIDLYRINENDILNTLDQIAFWDYLSSNNLIFIEWPEKVEKLFKNYNKSSIYIRIGYKGERLYRVL